MCPVFTGAKWEAEAACRDIGPDLFFSSDDDARDVAVQICEGCPVRVECLNAALSRNEIGIWGGVNTHNRRTLRGILKRKGPAAFSDAVDRLFNPPDPSTAPATPEQPCPRCDSVIPARPAGDPLPEDTNRPGAQCGYPSTYNRGCRCLACLAGKSDYREDMKRSPRGEQVKMADVHSIDARRTAS